jgi:hypothetical protein
LDCTWLHFVALKFIEFRYRFRVFDSVRLLVRGVLMQASGAALLVGVVAYWLAVLPLGAAYCLRSLVGVLLAALPLHRVMQARQTLKSGVC